MELCNEQEMVSRNDLEREIIDKTPEMYTSSKPHITQFSAKVEVETATQPAHIRDIDIHVDSEGERLQ